MIASAADQRGNEKARPLLVITATDEIGLDQPIVALAITSTFPDPPPPFHVEIPWNPLGFTATGLRKRSAVVCNWAVVLRPSQVIAIKGFLPGKYLLEVLTVRQKVERQAEREDSSHTPDTPHR